jgi:hypothetical protein
MIPEVCNRSKIQALHLIIRTSVDISFDPAKREKTWLIEDSISWTRAPCSRAGSRKSRTHGGIMASGVSLPPDCSAIGLW